MKLYTYPEAPSPRRVHLFLAEKGIEVDQEIIDLRAGEHFNSPLRDKNPECTLPVLELDDGTCFSQVMAICRYFEEIRPEPSLFGSSPETRAMVVERNRWVEMNGLLAVMEGFRNAAPGMKDHALATPRKVAQIPELAERGRQRFGWFMEDLDAWLSDHDFVGGAAFSVADLTALVTVDFGVRALKMEIPEAHEALAGWHRRISGRPAVRQADSSA